MMVGGTALIASRVKGLEEDKTMVFFRLIIFVLVAVLTDVRQAYAQDEMTIRGSSGSMLIYSGLPSSGLVGHWSMDSSSISGATLTNVANPGTANGTIYNSPQSINGRSLEALDFQRPDDDYVDINQGAIISPQQTFSVWIWPEEMSTNAIFSTILTPAGSGGDPDAGQHWRGYLAVNNGELLTGNRVNCSGTLNFLNKTFSGTIKANAWNHTVLTVDYTDPVTMCSWINGVSGGCGSAPVTSQTCSNEWNIIWIARRKDGRINFEGRIDDLRIYNRILTQAEILRLYRGLRAASVNP